MNNDRIALITNIPSPYRVIQFDQVHSLLGDSFCVFYSEVITPERKWVVPKIKHKHLFLAKSIFKKKWFNPDIYKQLKLFDPYIIITCGFNPTSLIAFLFSILHGRKHIVFTDSWLHSTKHLSFIHRLIRKIVFRFSDAFICVGSKGKSYLSNYGANESLIFTSPLAIDNAYFERFFKPINEREYDVMFSGQFVERKMPFFMIDVVKKLKEVAPDIKLLLIGSGKLQKEIIYRLEQEKIDYKYFGFIQQEDLPKYYTNAKLLLFPTKDDPWGLVANEACAAGTPVATCDLAGVANDLVFHEFNGFVMPLDVNVWAEEILDYLFDSKKQELYSRNARTSVQSYTIENAALGIIKAVGFLNNCER